MTTYDTLPIPFSTKLYMLLPRPIINVRPGQNRHFRSLILSLSLGLSSIRHDKRRRQDVVLSHGGQYGKAGDVPAAHTFENDEQNTSIGQGIMKENGCQNVDVISRMIAEHKCLIKFAEVRVQLVWTERRKKEAMNRLY